MEGKKLDRTFVRTLAHVFSLSRNFHRVSLYIISVEAEARRRVKIKTNYIKRDIEKDLISDESPFAYVTCEKIHVLRFYPTFEAAEWNKAPSRQIQTNSIMNSRQTGREFFLCRLLFDTFEIEDHRIVISIDYWRLIPSVHRCKYQHSW